jgi:para-nitrobenzyl esterase
MRPVHITSALFALVGAASAAPTALVRTQQGWVQGFTSGDLEQFRGVPYAAPPVGALRWRPPEAPKPYAGGVLQATSFAAPCAQARATAGLPAPSEDCLYLNIWRPANSFERKDMPVLVYIHGGGFGGGTGATLDGAPVADANDTIVVTINYRLSVFGLVCQRIARRGDV